MKYNTIPDWDSVNNIFYYDKKSGQLLWKNSKKPIKNNTIAGWITSKGYRRVRIGSAAFSAHRLVWFLNFKKWPTNQIDHINGNKNDNRLENLRDVTNRENNSNRLCHRKGKLVGASFNKKLKVWTSSITINKKIVYLGAFNNQQDANKAYLKKLEEIKNEIK